MNNEEPDDVVLATDEVPNDSTNIVSETGSGLAEAKETLTGEEILQRMATIRMRIDENADDLAAQVNALSDWRSYFRRYPWLSISAAAAIGFIIVPPKAKPGTTSFSQNTAGRTTTPAAEELRSVLVGAAKKAAAAYASKSIGAFVNGFIDSDEKI